MKTKAVLVCAPPILPVLGNAPVLIMSLFSIISSILLFAKDERSRTNGLFVS